jgi:type II secretory pathway predicted ATPase ExeA
MSYEQFFGLNDAPFSLAPNPRYLFASASHAAALEQLTSAIRRREPLIVMTGDIGTGKTLLCRIVLEQLDRKTFASVINDPLLERDDLLRQMLQDFGVMSKDRTTTAPAASRHDLVHALEDFLSSLVTLDAHAVVIIDEAQHVQPDVLEQIRLLANIDAPSGTMLQIILIGQLDMESLLARPELRQFQQRVSRRIRLEPLGEGELRSYIDHRLAVGRAAGARIPGAIDLARELDEWLGAGASETFTSDAVQAIWRWSAGLPRLVNLLCDRALEMACAQRLHTIDAGLVDAAAGALGLRADTAAGPAAAALEHVDHPVMPSLEPVESGSAVAAGLRAEAAAVPAAPAAEHVDTPVMPGLEPLESGSTVAPGLRAGAAAVPAAPVAEHFDSPVRPSLEPVESGSTVGPRQGRTGLFAVLGVAVAVAVVAAWFATRAPARPVNGPSATPAGRVPAAAPPGPAAAPTEPAGVPAPAAPPAATAAPERSPSASPPAGREAAAGSFEIVVASFKTEVRAAAVAAQVSDAGLPVRRRVVAGWQQVMSGPFASREEADAARQRLERAGLPGTQVVSSER